MRSKVIIYYLYTYHIKLTVEESKNNSRQRDRSLIDVCGCDDDNNNICICDDDDNNDDEWKLTFFN